MQKKILFATSEVLPLIKTGGLGDVSNSLPTALHKLGHDVRIVLPAYRETLARGEKMTLIGLLDIGLAWHIKILEGTLPGTAVKVWLVDSPAHFDRPGGPYTDATGKDWADNALRFAVFARAVEEIATGGINLHWQPDVVHCNDWQSGLIPALLSSHRARPGTVYTIHNLSYQGLFPAAAFDSLVKQLHVPARLWAIDGLEFYGQLSFMKGGLIFADMLTTVSPTYAKEIRSPDYGYTLAGLLTHRADRLTGILNGIDYETWNPARDPLITKNFDSNSIEAKSANKLALQKDLGLPQNARLPLIGMIGRMVEQKGVDLILAALDELMRNEVQLVVLGSGESRYEQAFLAAAQRYPAQLHVTIGFNEALAHQIESGADMFLMPSRFEPCGLNQLYSLRYGTVPIVRGTGGLADTVIDATEQNLADGTATGFVFNEPSVKALLAKIQQALQLYSQGARWRSLVTTGMRQDFSWERSAAAYLNVYEQAIQKTPAIAPKQ